MEWDGSIKTLPEPEADASGEGKWGCVAIWGLWQVVFTNSSDEEECFTKHQLVCSWGYAGNILA